MKYFFFFFPAIFLSFVNHRFIACLSNNRLCLGWYFHTSFTHYHFIHKCEAHWDAKNDRWIPPEQAQAVPAGSRFESNNNFFTKVDFNALNILVVGDSVGENMALFLENSHADLGVYKHLRESYREQINLEGRYQDRIWINNVPQEKGGGYVAFAR